MVLKSYIIRLFSVVFNVTCFKIVLRLRLYLCCAYLTWSIYLELTYLFFLYLSYYLSRVINEQHLIKVIYLSKQVQTWDLVVSSQPLNTVKYQGHIFLLKFRLWWTPIYWLSSFLTTGWAENEIQKVAM